MIFSILSPGHWWHVVVSVSVIENYWTIIILFPEFVRICQNWLTLIPQSEISQAFVSWPGLLFAGAPPFFRFKLLGFSCQGSAGASCENQSSGPFPGSRGISRWMQLSFFWVNCLTFDWILGKTKRGRHRLTPRFPRLCQGRMKSHQERDSLGQRPLLPSLTAGQTWGWTSLWRDGGPASRLPQRRPAPGLSSEHAEATGGWSSSPALNQTVTMFTQHFILLTSYLVWRGCSPGLRTWRSSPWRWRRSSRCCRCCRRGWPRSGGGRTRSVTRDNDDMWHVMCNVLRGWCWAGANIAALLRKHGCVCGAGGRGYGTVLTGSWLTPCQSSYLVSGAGW